MLDDSRILVEALKGNVRVNTSNRTVEIYDEYGVKLVLRDLDDTTYEAFKANYQNY